MPSEAVEAALAAIAAEDFSALSAAVKSGKSGLCVRAAGRARATARPRAEHEKRKVQLANERCF